MKTIRDLLTHLYPRNEDTWLAAEILLSHILNVSRAYLHTWPDEIIATHLQAEFTAYMARYLAGEPIAYLIGAQDFWTLTLKVTPDTLIPRPETESLVALALQKFPVDATIHIADLGTGSGAIALAIAHERPKWTVYATDADENALNVAKENASLLKINNVIFQQGNWLSALPRQGFDAIISNPPYIEKGDEALSLNVLKYEPSSALFAEEKGLADLAFIIAEAKHYLKPGGYLLLEHGFNQAKDVARLLETANFDAIILHQDLAGLDRLTEAKMFECNGFMLRLY